MNWWKRTQMCVAIEDGPCPFTAKRAVTFDRRLGAATVALCARGMAAIWSALLREAGRARAREDATGGAA